LRGNKKLKEYILKIELITDAVFGSGYSIPGFIDSDVLYDDSGFPYINGKTFKGKIAEAGYLFVNMSKNFKDCEELSRIMQNKAEKLFGVEGGNNQDTLKFTDAEISKQARYYFRQHMKENGVDKLEVLEALTHIDTQTSIDYRTGVAKGESLRSMRVINRGLTLYSSVFCPVDLDDDEKILLASACSLLRHFGTNETKGKGEVKVSLLCEQIDVTNDYIKLIEKGGE
jgi:hypothetical protein